MVLSELINFSEGDSEFTVRISMPADATHMPKTVIFEICKYFHRLLQMDIKMLYLAVKSDPQDLEGLFHLAGVNEMAFQSLGDDSWLSSSTGLSRPLLNGIRSIQGASGSDRDQRVVSANSNGTHIYETSTVENTQNEISHVMDNLSGRLTPEVRILTSGHFPIQSLAKLATSPVPTQYLGILPSVAPSINVSKAETETQHGTSGSTLLARSLSARNYSAAAPIATASSSGWEPSMVFAETSQPSPYQKINGILGELHVRFF